MGTTTPRCISDRRTVATMLVIAAVAMSASRAQAATEGSPGSFMASPRCAALESAWRTAFERARAAPDDVAKATEVKSAYRRAVEVGCINHSSTRSSDRQYLVRLVKSIRAEERCRSHQLKLLNVASKAERFVDARQVADSHFADARGAGCA